MRIVLVEPGKAARSAEIKEGLHSMQEIVDGPIQALYPWDDPVAVICNDEGKIDQLPLNRVLEDYDIIAGTFLVAGLTKSNFGSLSPKLLKKYHDLFYSAELFQIDHHQIKCTKIPPKTKRRSHKSVDDLVR